MIPRDWSRLRRRRAVRLIWLGAAQLLVVVLFLAPLPWTELFAPDPAYRHTAATLTRLDPPGTPPIQVTLPYNLLASRPAFTDRYDLAVPREPLEAAAPPALYIPYTSRNLDIRVNDVLVFEGVRATAWHNAERPGPILLPLPLPPRAANAERDTISLTYRCDTVHCTTANGIYIGPDDRFRGNFVLLTIIVDGVLYFYTGVLFLGIACATIGLFLGFSGQGLAQARNACVVLLFNQVLTLLPELPTGLAVASGWLPILAMTLLIHAEFRLLRRPLHQRIWLLYAPTYLVLLAIPLAVQAKAAIPYLRLAGIATVLLLLGIHHVLLWRHALHRRLRLLLLLAAPGILVTGQAIGAMLYMIGLSHQNAMLAPRLAPLLAVLAVLLLMGQTIWSFSIRYRRLIQRMPVKLRHLDEQLTTRHRQDLAVQQKLWQSDERGRLMSDLHDGLGGALVSIIAASETERYSRSYISDAARSALNEMRLIVDALDSSEGDLRQIMASWQARNAMRMEPFGIRLDVTFKETGGLQPTVPTESLLNFLKILDELVTNACKHSGGTQVSVTISTVTDDWKLQRCYIAVTDNGSGFPKPVPRGKGMASMQRRAQAIGAVITIIATRAGTMVTLLMPPLPPAHEP